MTDKTEDLVSNEVVTDGASTPEGRESPSINERPKLRDSIRAALKEHTGDAPEKDRERKPASSAERPRDETGRFAPAEKTEKPAKEAGADNAAVEPAKELSNPDANKQVAPQSQTAVDRPAAWGSDKSDLWSKLPPDAQAYIAKREAEVSQGFAKYGEDRKRLQEYESVMTPLRPTLQGLGQSDMDGIRRMIEWQQSLAGPYKVEAFKGLARALGVDLATLVPASPQGQQDPQADPVAQHLQPILHPVISRINEFGQKLTTFEQQQQQERINRASAELAAFAKDKPHFDRVRTRMAQLMTAGVATSLDDAYQQAIWADPDTRAEIQRTEQEKREAEAKAAQEAERQKQAAAEEERKKKEAAAAAKARKASVSPRTSTPGAALGGVPAKRGQSVRESIASALKESSSRL